MKRYLYSLSLLLCMSLYAQQVRENSEGLGVSLADKAPCQPTQSCPAPTPSFENSFIIYPAKDATITTKTPIIIGIVRDAKKQALKNAKVRIVADDKILGVVRTNIYGVWSYIVKPHQAFANGYHTVSAVSKPSDVLLGQVSFYVAMKSPVILRAGNVDSTFSLIAYPSENAFINSTTPPIVGFVNDSSANPVEGESVTLSIDSTTVANVSSDSNGVFSYILDSSQALTEGSHTVNAYANESSVALQPQNFTIDVTAPDAPVITSPTQNSIITSHTVTVQGTTEPYATITVFVDGDNLGTITVADGNGDWSTEVFLANGNHSVTAQAEDIAFNVGPLSSAVSFTVSV
jgi:hypothetical protein